ncbi:MAG: DUF4178 domain-containing protein [Bacteroidia bacterium]|nr:DUF4178 domain-containing protein [Bacteroidia bacterium]
MALKTIACTKCGSPVPLRALGVTVNVACEACGSVLDLSDPNRKVLLQNKFKDEYPPKLAMGSRCTLEGTSWEVIGQQVRQDLRWHFTWEEYLLFNPRYGFRWLVCSDGHWVWVKTQAQLTATLNANAGSVVYQSTTFRKYHAGTAKTVFVRGEFYWRLSAGDAVAYADYIAPPHQFSIEGGPLEQTVSLGTYLPTGVLVEAFGLERSPTRPAGVAPTQPNPFSPARQLVWLYPLLLGILLAVQLVLDGLSPRTEVLRSEAITARDSAGVLPEATYGPFQVAKGPVKTQVQLFTQEDNSWVDFEAVLYNSTTQEVRSFYLGAEYYHGTDAGESWSEGSTRATVTLAGLPAGTYYLTLEGQVEANGMPHAWQVRVVTGGVYWGNWWLAVVILSLVCGVYYLLYQQFEVKRWADSDYTV